MEDRAIGIATGIQSEYEDFKNIHELFSYLYDHRFEQISNTYTKQTQLIENANYFWSLIIKLCNKFKIPLVIGAHDIENLFHGFDTETIEEFRKSKRYFGIHIKKIIAVEEDLLIHSIKSIFDTLLARLELELKKGSQKSIEHPHTQIEQYTDSLANCQTLTNTDTNILMAMNSNPQKSMLKVDIIIAAGHQKYAVLQSLKRLESMGMVYKPENAKRKGWALTDKGILTADNL
ncbi:MAG: hypothetical protein A2Y10_17970 [Planctomycetes bacterium GWF2_41_51]|nr:MAG: hypothetical protein A2Y10_17970 [Planctomycetes bacterium GWF2_41_51]